MPESPERLPGNDESPPLSAQPSEAPTEPKLPEHKPGTDAALGDTANRATSFPILSEWDVYERHRRLILDERSRQRTVHIDSVDTDSSPLSK